jgi:hypothetical protein
MKIANGTRNGLFQYDSNNVPYSVGDLILHNGKLYYVIADFNSVDADKDLSDTSKVIPYYEYIAWSEDNTSGPITKETFDQLFESKIAGIHDYTIETLSVDTYDDLDEIDKTSIYMIRFISTDSRILNCNYALMRTYSGTISNDEVVIQELIGIDNPCIAIRKFTNGVLDSDNLIAANNTGLLQIDRLRTALSKLTNRLKAIRNSGNLIYRVPKNSSGEYLVDGSVDVINLILLNSSTRANVSSWITLNNLSGDYYLYYDSSSIHIVITESDGKLKVTVPTSGWEISSILSLVPIS